MMLKDEFKVLADLLKSAREPNQQINHNLTFEQTLTEMQKRRART